MSPPTEAPPRLSPMGRAGLVPLLLAAAAGRAVFLTLPVNSDTAMFVYAGKLVAGGGLPGVDLLDNKLPTVGLLMSVPWRCFGANWTAYAAIGLVASIIATLCLYRAVRSLWGGSAAIVAAVAATAWLDFTPAVYGGLQLEAIQVFFASIAAATTLRVLRDNDWRDAMLVGLCAGTAAWAKPTGAAVAAAAVFAVSTAGAGTPLSRVRTCAWIALGTALPVVLAAWTIVVTGMGDALPETLRQLRDYAGQSSLEPMDWLKPVIVLIALSLPAVVLGVICRRDPRHTTARRADAVFVLAWLGVELVGVVSQRRMYAYHFLTLGPPAALATALVARQVRAKSLVMAFGPLAGVSAALAVMAYFDRPTDSRDDRVIAYVNTHAAANDTVWADDYPRLLVESDHRAGSAVPLIFLMANGDAAPEYFGDRLLADFAARRPGFVVFADPDKVAALYQHHMADVAASPARADAMAFQLRRIQAYLTAYYHPAADIGNVRVWRRRGTIGRDSTAAGG